MSILDNIWNLRRPRNRDREEGTLYQYSVTNRYKAPEVTADRIRKLDDNAYFVKLEQNQRNLIFCEKVEIAVKNPSGEIDEALTEQITAMTDADDVRLNQKLIMIWSSVWRYGAAFINDVWGWRGAEYRLLDLRLLPAYTFANIPTQGDYISYGDILRGVVLNKDYEMEYWQKQDETGDPIQVKNITMIKDPTESAIAGVPGCLPAVHIINMLAYCHKAQMQKVNRVGAPSLFPKITTMVKRAVGISSDGEYLKTMLQNWGTNVGFPLRENMEFADPHIEDNATALDTIKHYEGILDRLYSPSSMISKDGTLIGGSNMGELELVKMNVSTIHRWVEEAAESMLQHYLDVNGYAEQGYTVEVTIPLFDIDQTQLDIQLMTALRETATAPALATLDEMRDLVGLPPADDKIRAELEKTRPQPQPAAQPLSFGLKQPPLVETPAEVEEDEADDLEKAYADAFMEVIAALEDEPIQANRTEGEGSWVTINGVHILIKEGETAADAFKRTTGKDLPGGSAGGGGGSSSGGGGKPDGGSITGRDTKGHKAAQSFEGEKFSDTKESAAVYTKNGDTLLSKSGTAHEVSFSREEVSKMKGGILTHNHPGSATSPTLSLADYDLAASADLSEMRAVSGNRVYVFTPGEKGWPPNEKVADSLSKNIKLHAEKLRVDIKSGKITKAEAEQKVWKAAWRSTAGECGFGYAVEARK